MCAGLQSRTQDARRGYSLQAEGERMVWSGSSLIDTLLTAQQHVKLQRVLDEEKGPASRPRCKLRCGCRNFGDNARRPVTRMRNQTKVVRRETVTL